MQKLVLLLVAFVFSAVGAVDAQKRYLEEVFTNVKTTPDVEYGVNATVLALSVAGQAIPQSLRCDIYEPMGDSSSARPLVIMLHTGNFLPPANNGGCTGTKSDAALVAMARKLARRGFVVAIANYRLGWNPISPSQPTRVATLINAAYRGVQDSRTAVRFFKRNVAEGGNAYGIDPDKITIWGNGTGGYISAASSTLDTITDTFIPKFFIGTTPMVIEEINGNVNGTTVGITPPGYPGFPAGDTLCYPNHVGFSSDFQLAVNLGGALGDTSWMDASDLPIISYHVPSDPFAPCEQGIINVPPPVNLPVVEVQGSCLFQRRANALGLNAKMVDANFIDSYTTSIKSRNGNIEGFVPFYSSSPTESAQWNYSSVAEPYGVMGSACGTDSVASFVYIDTIMNFFAPRACVVLGLGCNLDGISSTKNLLDANTVGLSIAPNPMTSVVNIRTNATEMFQSVYVYDMNGRLVQAHVDLNTNEYQIRRNNLNPGMYVVQLRFKNGIVSSRVMVQ